MILCTSVFLLCFVPYYISMLVCMTIVFLHVFSWNTSFLFSAYQSFLVCSNAFSVSLCTFLASCVSIVQFFYALQLFFCMFFHGILPFFFLRINLFWCVPMLFLYLCVPFLLLTLVLFNSFMHYSCFFFFCMFFHGILPFFFLRINLFWYVPMLFLYLCVPFLLLALVLFNSFMHYSCFLFLFACFSMEYFLSFFCVSIFSGVFQCFFCISVYLSCFLR